MDGTIAPLGDICALARGSMARWCLWCGPSQRFRRCRPHRGKWSACRTTCREWFPSAWCTQQSVSSSMRLSARHGCCHCSGATALHGLRSVSAQSRQQQRHHAPQR